MTQRSLEHFRPYLRPALIGALICALLAANLVTVFFFGPRLSLIMAVFLGICIGQVNLIATWAALAPGNVLVRLPWSMLLGVLMWFSLVSAHRLQWLADSLGLSVYLAEIDRSDTIVLGIFLLAGILVAQIPLWIAGQVFRWKLVYGEMLDSVPRHQFNLRHVLLGMFLLSLALAAVRAVLPTAGRRSIHVDLESVVVLGVIVLCNLLITVPCIWGSFAPARQMLRLAIGWVVYCTVLTGAEFGMVCLISGAPRNSSAEIIETATAFLLFNLSQCATVLGSLLLLRAAGLRFVRLPIARRSCSQAPMGPYGASRDGNTDPC